MTYILQQEILHLTIPYIDNVPVKGPPLKYLLENGSCDFKLAIHGPLEHSSTTSLGIEHIGELPKSKLGSCIKFFVLDKRNEKDESNIPQLTMLPLNWTLNFATSIWNIPMSLV